MSVSEDILEDFKSGKFQLFYQAVFPDMLLYASRNLPPDYVFLAEDTVQNAIYSAYNRKKDFQNLTGLKIFIYSCVHNSIVSYHRKSQSKQKYLEKTKQEEYFEDSLIEQETLSLLYQAIDALPPKYKTLFNYSFEQGLKNAEVAGLMGVSESAIKKSKARMLEILRTKLGEDLPDTILIITFISEIMNLSSGFKG